MNNTTYILGAGASANAIPVVNMMDYRLGNFLSILKIFHEQKLKPNNYNFSEYCFDNFPLFLTNLEKTIDKVIEHYSFDTYAKKLYLTKSDSYRQLKQLINTYILFEQIGIKNLSAEFELDMSFFNQGKIASLNQEENKYLTYVGRTNFDNRYDVFFASILNNNIKWNDKIKILTYNYDNQIEIAYDFYQDYYSSYDDLKIFFKHYQENLNIIKLNGFCSYFDIDDYGNHQLNSDKANWKFNTFRMLKLIFKLYSSFTNSTGVNLNTNIHFAWEDEEYSQNALLSTIKIMNETTNLVIIGYSFPEFNRTNDETILSQLNPNSRIFIQTTKETYQSLCSRFNQRSKYMFKKRIEEVLFIDQFFIP